MYRRKRLRFFRLFFRGVSLHPLVFAARLGRCELHSQPLSRHCLGKLFASSTSRGARDERCQGLCYGLRRASSCSSEFELRERQMLHPRSRLIRGFSGPCSPPLTLSPLACLFPMEPIWLPQFGRRTQPWRPLESLLLCRRIRRGRPEYFKEYSIELINGPVVVVLQLGAATDAVGLCCFA